MRGAVPGHKRHDLLGPADGRSGTTIPSRRYSPDCRCSVDANRPQSDPPAGSRRRTGISRRNRPCTTVRGNSGRPVPDLAGRDFPSSGPDELRGHITCVPTQPGALYLAVVLDAFSRRVFGWALIPPPHDPCAWNPGPGPQTARPRRDGSALRTRVPLARTLALRAPSLTRRGVDAVDRPPAQLHFLLRGGCGLICGARGLEVSPDRTIYGGKSVHRPWTDECR